MNRSERDSSQQRQIEAGPAQDLRELFTVLMIALAVVFIRKLPPIPAVLDLLPVLGASIPFFLLTLGLLIWSLKNGRTWRDFGLARPTSLIQTLFWGVGAGGVRLLSSSVLAPVLAGWIGSEPVLTRIEPLQGNLPLLLVLLPLMWVMNGLGEEVLHRGFVLTRLAKIWGDHRNAWLQALLVQAFFFGVGHAYQGATGIILTGFAAVIYGGVYILSGRNLWTAVIAHGLANSVAFVQSYQGMA